MKRNIGLVLIVLGGAIGIFDLISYLTESEGLGIGVYAGVLIVIGALLVGRPPTKK